MNRYIRDYIHIFPNHKWLLAALFLGLLPIFGIVLSLAAHPAWGGSGASCSIPPVAGVEKDASTSKGTHMESGSVPPIDAKKPSSLATAVFGLG